MSYNYYTMKNNLEIRWQHYFIVDNMNNDNTIEKKRVTIQY